MHEKGNPVNDQTGTLLPGAFYGRMSDPRQKRSSIVDQHRNCEEGASEKGFYIPPEFCYKDPAKTGTTLFGRRGFAVLRATYKQDNPSF